MAPSTPMSPRSASSTPTPSSPRRTAPSGTRCAPSSTTGPAGDRRLVRAVTSRCVSWPWSSDLGLLGMHLQGYGCAGTSATAYGLACLELEAGDSGLRSLVSVQGSLAMFAIWQHGSEEQKQEWLPRMAAGEAIGCFGLTEPDFGSDPGGMRTRARRDGDDWVLDGTRCGSRTAGRRVAVVWARDRRGHPRVRRPDRHAGFSRHEIKQQDVAAGLGHRRAGARRRPAPGDGDAARGGGSRGRCPA